MMSNYICLSFLLVAMLISTGCSSVKPWEKGYLADYTMKTDRDVLDVVFTEHMWFSREAASGGASIGGGGCGCN